jgi:hypothetical protein
MVRKLLQTGKVVARGDRALRIGRGGDEHRHGPGQRRFVERVEIRQKSVGEGGRQVDRLATGCAGSGAIGRIERVGHQDRRLAPPRPDVAGGRDRREKQPFPAAVQHQDFALGIDRPWQVEPGRQPVRGRPPERLDALGEGIAPEIGDVFCKDGPDKVRDRVLRFAQRQRNQRLGRLVGRQQFGRPHKRRALGLTGRGCAAGALRHAGRGGHCHV